MTSIPTEVIREALQNRAPDLFRHMWGEPVSPNVKDWRAKDSSARVMKMSGADCGLWHDHKAGQGGDVFDAIAVSVCGLGKAGDDFPKVKRAAAEFCGLSGGSTFDIDAARKRNEQRLAEGQRESVADAEKRARLITTIKDLSGPISGTPAQAYLTSRSLTDIQGAGLAYCPPLAAGEGVLNPELGALVVWARNDAGEIVGGQRILVAPDGTRPNISARKVGFAQIGGAPARFPARVEGGPLCVAESPEAALSVWMATGFETWAVFGVGQFQSAPLPDGRKVILCPDRDAPIGTYPKGSKEAVSKESAARAFRKAAQQHVKAGLNVWIALAPEPVGSKADLNDTHQRAGLDAVKCAIDGAVRVEGPRPPDPEGHGLPPAYELQGGSLGEARQTVADTFRRWAQSATEWVAPDADAPEPAPVFGVRVSTGVGKSYAARIKAVELARELRNTGNTAPIVIAVPRHDLAEEYLSSIDAGELSVEVYRGRARPDPEKPGHNMCWRSDEARDVQIAGADVSQTLCRQGQDRCPFYEKCGALRQGGKRADIWIVPHKMLWRKPPACIGKPAALIVDESPTGDAYDGFDGKPRLITFDELSEPVGELFGSAGLHEQADLNAALTKIRAHAEHSPDGRIRPDQLEISGDDLSAARATVFRALITPDIGPTSPQHDVRRELAWAGPRNRRVLRTARLLGLVKSALKDGAKVVPGVTIETRQTEDGESYKAVRLRWRESISDGWNVPTIVASATAQDRSLRAVWPAMGQVVEASADLQHTKVRQITDRQFGLSSLNIETPYGHRMLKRLRRYLETRAAACGGDTLIIAQKRVLEALGELPTHIRRQNIDAVHFNALSGLDKWRAVRLVFVIGRTMPSPTDVELRAEVLGGDYVEPVQSWYEKTPAALPMRDGSAGPQVFARGGKGREHTYGCDRHPHALAEAIRWEICEGEIMQAIGRPRGVNRTEDTPLQIDVLTNIPLPVPVDEAGTFESFEPQPEEVLAARGFIVPDTSSRGAWNVIAAVLPDMFATPEAARDAFKARAVSKRSRGENLISILIGISPREDWKPAKVQRGRYATPVEIRCASRDEAVSLCERHGLKLAELAQPVKPDERRNPRSEAARKTLRSLTSGSGSFGIVGGRDSDVARGSVQVAEVVSGIAQRPGTAPPTPIENLTKPQPAPDGDALASAAPLPRTGTGPP